MNTLRMVLFLATATALVTGVHVYLYRRLVRDVTADQRLRRAGVLVLTLMALALLGARGLYLLLPRGVASAYAVGAWLWMGLATYLFLSALTVEALGVGVRAWRRRRAVAPLDPHRRQLLSRVAAGSAAMVSSSLVGYGYWRAYHPPVITDLSVKLPNLPASLDGLRIVHLSDIHVSGTIDGRFMKEMVHRCNALKPDLVAITGDLVDGDVPTLGPAVAELRGLHGRFGSFFVTGNHEYYSGDVAWSAALEKMGIQVLRNRRVSIGDAGGSLELIGVDDWSATRIPLAHLTQATQGRRPEQAAVLLAHQPREFREAVALGIGLQLSGHTHGGQFFPGTALISAIWEFASGHFTSGPGHLYVSRGTGFWGPPLRVGSPPEIVRITLTT